MKIVHVITGLEKNGAEIMLRRLIKANLVDDFISSHKVISLTGLGHYDAVFQAQGEDVCALGLLSMLCFCSRLGGFNRLIALVEDIKSQIVQTWIVRSDSLGGLAAGLASASHVIRGGGGLCTSDYSIASRDTRTVRWQCARLSSFVANKIIRATQASLEASVKANYLVKKVMAILKGFYLIALPGQVGSGATIS
jgi:hypothetical protein